MSRVVKVGALQIGGKNPVRIKGMLKSSYAQPLKLIREAQRLEKEGVEALRIAVKEEQYARLAKTLKKHVTVPLVADIHFHARLALLAIEYGFDAIRLNPLNICKRKEIIEITRAAKQAGISIRVGVNSGGFKTRFSSPQLLAAAMVKKTAEYISILEQENFFDIMVSLKGSDVHTTTLANRLFVRQFNYPLHLGVTASGYFLDGIVKSSLGIGTLLSEGIGSVIRVSLTAPSFWEIRVAKIILQSLNLRRFGSEIISCPTCSRCEVNLIKIVEKFKDQMEKEKFAKPLKIALMGCVVNGPGEAAQADIGAAFGSKKAVIFKKNKIIGWSNDQKIIEDLLNEARRL